MRVREIMSTPVVGVTTEATVDEAAKLMMDRGFTTVPVFTAGGRLVGVLTEADLGGAQYLREREAGGISGATTHLARQVMRAPALAVPGDADLADVAAAMVQSHQRCLPVVEAGRVVGMVSWRDLLSHFTRDPDRPQPNVPSN